MNFLKKYWPTILSVGGAAVPFLMPSITAYAAANPKSIIGVLCACVIMAYHSTAPKDSTLRK